jgi:hypothetical protein
MVDHATGDFAGLYEWEDGAGATGYARGLERILRAISTPGSVSALVTAAPSVDAYLAPRSGDDATSSSMATVWSTTK